MNELKSKDASNPIREAEKLVDKWDMVRLVPEPADLLAEVKALARSIELDKKCTAKMNEAEEKFHWFAMGFYRGINWAKFKAENK